MEVRQGSPALQLGVHEVLNQPLNDLLDLLQRELEETIAGEEFERAATLRDQLKDLPPDPPDSP